MRNVTHGAHFISSTMEVKILVEMQVALAVCLCYAVTRTRKTEYAFLGLSLCCFRVVDFETDQVLMERVDDQLEESCAFDGVLSYQLTTKLRVS